MNLSNNFAYWLSVQGEPAMLPSQTKSVTNILRNLQEADLISVMYYGSDELACNALKELKKRFENEMNELDELNNDQGRRYEQESEYAGDWN
jgi:hypothetical protein